MLNVHTENLHFEAVQRFLSEISPDLIVLIEVNERWLKELPELRQTHPHHLVQPQDDNFGIALFSRLPLRETNTVILGDAEVPSMTAKLLIGTNSIFAIATHPLPPGSSEDAASRNQQLAKTAELARAQKVPVAVLGDLNVTPWSPYFRRLLKDSGLKNTAQGHGIQASWPTFFPPLRIPIDHVLVSREFSVIRRFLGPKVGSDHFPIVLDLALP